MAANVEHAIGLGCRQSRPKLLCMALVPVYLEDFSPGIASPSYRCSLGQGRPWPRGPSGIDARGEGAVLKIVSSNKV